MDAAAWRAAFDRIERERNEPAWLQQLRRESFEAFADLGFPTRKNEEWRYTPVAPVGKKEWILPVQRPAETRPRSAVIPAFDPTADRICLVFVDGCFVAEASSLPEVSGLTVAPLRASLDRLGRADVIGNGERPRSGFDALHGAFFSDGLVIDVSADTEIATPIELVFSGDTPSVFSSVRTVIRLARNARATLVERHSPGEGPEQLRVDGGSFELAEGSQLEHIRIQDDSAGSYRVVADDVTVGRSASFRHVGLTLGGRVARETLTVRVDGPGAHTDLAVLYAPGSGQLHDHHTCIDHRAPACTADQLYKGILDADGVAVFNGKIFVQKPAQQTSAMQLNQNLMLSPAAHVDTKPQLEIFADDVRCTHGATVGSLDPEELFYLGSRSISPAQAKGLLVRGFAEDVIARVRNGAIAAEMGKLLDRRLAG